MAGCYFRAFASPRKILSFYLLRLFIITRTPPLLSIPARFKQRLTATVGAWDNVSGKWVFCNSATELAALVFDPGILGVRAENMGFHERHFYGIDGKIRTLQP